MKNKKIVLEIIIILLLLVWIPVTFDKIINFNSYQSAISRQPVSRGMAQIAIYMLPIIETATIAFLVTKSLRQLGLLLSSLLMIIFTSYVGFVLYGTGEKLPCGCGSVISNLSWSEHLWFNIIYLLISLIGVIINLKINKDSSVQITNSKIQENKLL